MQVVRLYGEDGILLAEKRALASIEINQPNGEGCPPKCKQGSEVDFIWARAARAVGIEVKASSRWRASDGRALKDLREAGTVQRCFAVYGGDRELQDGPIAVLPFERFARELSAGRVLSSRAAALRPPR